MRWKDYRAGDQVKTMTLSAGEFIRRFLLHALPNGFRRIRFYGFLGNRHCEEKLAVCRHLLGVPQVEEDNAEPVIGTDYRARYEWRSPAGLKPSAGNVGSRGRPVQRFEGLPQPLRMSC